MKHVVIGVLFFGAIGLLVWKGVVEGGIPVLLIQDLKPILKIQDLKVFLKIQDLKASPPEGICGIEGGVIHSIESMAPPRFTIRSETSQGVTFAVEARCGAPDNFKVGNRVSVCGTFDAKAEKFIADQVQAAGICRIEGGVIHSIESVAPSLRFTIRPEKSQGPTLAVEARCGAPDNFKLGNKVSICGTFDALAEKFIADEVQTACPSKYEASKDAGAAKPGGATSTAAAPLTVLAAEKEK